MNPVQVFAVENLPLIKKGDNIGKLIVEAAKKQNNPIQQNDVVVVTHVVVSKAEGNVINLDQVKPSEKAKEIAPPAGWVWRNSGFGSRGLVRRRGAAALIWLQPS